MDEAQARNVVAQLERDKAAPSRQQRLLETAKREQQAYDELCAKLPPGQGWTVNRESITYMERVQPRLGRLLRGQAMEMDKTFQIVPYGGVEWCVFRPMSSLANEELISGGRRYLKAFKREVAEGKCADRPELWAAVGEVK
jgi:hypothetical protein